MLRVAFIILALAVAFPAHARDVNGTARVIDVDTLWLGQIKIRLKGIDAPERGKARFNEATNVLARLVAGKTVLCR